MELSVTFVSTCTVLHEGMKKRRKEGGGKGIPDQRENIGRFIERVLNIKCGGDLKWRFSQ